MLRRQWLGVGHVEGRPQPAARRLGQESVGVDDLAAGDVDEQRAVLHRGEELRPGQPLGGLGERESGPLGEPGIRVVNVFPGPIDDEWNQNLPPPKVAPAALAGAIVKALREGVEDVYPGDVAQEWVERWRENPKVLERELAAGG